MRFSRVRAGFSLVELSIVIVVIAVVAAMGMSMGKGMVESAKRGATYQRLNTIEDALMAYRVMYDRLPCPADPSLAATDPNYGVEAANPGACTGGVPAAPYADAANNVVEGAVPVGALQLPLEYMYDGWGRKIAYAVNYNVTYPKAMKGQDLSDQCNITVTNASGNTRSTGAVYALVSYGQDGHGGYTQAGNRYSAGSTNANEHTNCHCDSTAATTGYAATYVQMNHSEDPSSSKNMFDNLVRYKERRQMFDYEDPYDKQGAVCARGFQANGVNGGDSSGYSVAVGDINGDGIPDLIIGAPWANGRAGYVYVVYGTKSGFPNPLPLNSLNGSNGFRVDGVLTDVAVGTSVAVGDINGDGIPDLIIGGSGFFSMMTPGYTYVVFGGPTRKGGTPWAASQTLSTGGTNLINGTDGFRLDGPDVGGQLGYGLAVADINNDGIPDLIIGEEGANTNAGYVYVVFGGPTRKSGIHWQPTQTLSLGVGNLINGVDGFRLDGVAGDYAGLTIAVGDINGDGIPDILMGLPISDGVSPNSSGAADVVFGGPTRKSGAAWGMNTVLSTGAANLLNGIDGFRIDGDASMYGEFGQSVALADINGDGYADMVIGARQTNTDAGSAYVIFGGPTRKSGVPWPSTGSLEPNTGSNNIINGIDGFRLDGPDADYMAGWSVATGDFDGDGYPDIVIGSPVANYNSVFAGATYIVFGGPTRKSGIPWSSVNPMSIGPGNLIDGTDGLRFDGVSTFDNNGWSVALADINGDGYADIVTSSLGVNSLSGATYVIFGGPTEKSGAAWPASGHIVLNTGAGNFIDGINGARFDAQDASEGEGSYVAVGDINGDGTPDILIGAYAANGSKGYLYTVYGVRNNAPWPATQVLNTFKW